MWQLNIDLRRKSFAPKGMGLPVRGEDKNFSWRHAAVPQGSQTAARRSDKNLRLDLRRKIDPLVTVTLSLLEARQALTLLASGTAGGKIVLINP